MAYEFTQNRELSWLKFNERVLEEANNSDIPLLERIKFFEIFNSNLDEFFMIRVGSLKDLDSIKSGVIDSKTGMTPKEQLIKIYDAVRKIYNKKDNIYKSLVEEISKNGISFLQLKNYKDEKKIRKFFKQEILPYLSAQIIDINHPFPHLENKRSYIITILESNEKIDTYGIVAVPDSIPSYLEFDGNYIFSEKLIYDLSDIVFKGYKIKNKNIIRVTRNADLNVEDGELELQDDFRKVMRQLIKKRNRLNPVRVECHKTLQYQTELFLKEKLKIENNEFFVSKSPFSLNFIYNIINKAEYKDFLYPKLEQKDNSYIDINKGIINQIRKKDVLLFYPFERMEPFLRLIKEAANDKNVTAIQITIYRLSQHSRLVDYLCQAAENGKEVTALIELRARFDENSNINYSEKLEEAGCHVMYGFDEFKVHSKICLTTLKIDNKVSYITQIGTGNYNEKTVNLYTDYSLMTANPKIGVDAHNFFQNMLLGNLYGEYNELLVAPHALRPQIISLIDEEIKKGSNGYIFFKLNSITDINIINKLSEASKAGVKIELIIRGICTILPEIPRHTENISIMSIVGRFLEHSRIYMFGKGNSAKIYISSADMMTRNTIRRVEIAVPILENDIKEEIKEHINIMLHDNINGRKLTSTGDYVSLNNETLVVNSHEYFLHKPEIEKNKKNVISVKMALNKLIAINKIECKKNQSIILESLGTKLIVDYIIANKYVLVVNIGYSEEGMRRFYEKYYLLNSIFSSKNIEMIIVLKNKVEDSYLKRLKTLGINCYTIDNLEELVDKLKK